MKLLQPSSLRLGACWDGNVRHAATICVTVEVVSEPNSGLILLEQTKDIALSHSMVWRINNLGQEVPGVDVRSSKSILAHQIDYPLPSPPMRLFPASQGYEDRYGIAAKPDSFFMDWFSTDDAKKIPDDHVIISKEPKGGEVDEHPIAIPDIETPSENLAIDEASAAPLSEKNLRQWTGSDWSIEQWFDDSQSDMLPSPSPSSRELIPWASTKEIMERLKAEEEKKKETDPPSLSSEVIVAPTPQDPGIVHECGKMVLDFPYVVESKLYRVDIYCLKDVRERLDRWFELDLTEIGRACLNLEGRFVLEAPWDFDCDTPALSDALSDAEIAHGRLECKFSPHRLRNITFRRREDRDRDCAGMGLEDETRGIVANMSEVYNQSIQNNPQRAPNEAAQPIEEEGFIPSEMSPLNEKVNEYIPSGREDGEHYDPTSYSNSSDVSQFADELTPLLRVSVSNDASQTLIEQLPSASGPEPFHQRTQDNNPQALKGMLEPVSDMTATLRSETRFQKDETQTSIEDISIENSLPEIVTQNSQSCSPQDQDEILRTQSANEVGTAARMRFLEDEVERPAKHPPNMPAATEQTPVEPTAVKPSSIERATLEHTSNKHDPKNFRRSLQEKGTQVSDEMLQTAYKTVPTQAFLHRVIVCFFFAVVAFFSATRGPPEAIATPSSTVSTLRSVAGGIWKHGSTMHTVVLNTFREAQMPQSLRVSQILWKNQWVTGVADETGEMASVEISTLTSEARCRVIYKLATGGVLRTTDVPTQTLDMADVSDGDDDDDYGAAIRAPCVAGFLGNMRDDSVTGGSGSETENFVTGKANITLIAARSDENATDTRTSHHGKWAWATGIGKRILSRVGCSTSAHCIMLAASADDDPQWEVLERSMRCEEPVAGGNVQDQIDKFLGWKPCDLRPSNSKSL